jgi:hypothetical protein
MRYCFLLLVFISSVSFAQTNFRPGVLVTLSGDSVKGSVDDQQWRRNPKSIKFREGNAEKLYSPGDIKAFTVSGKVSYESHRVKYDSSSERESRLTSSHLALWKEKGLFLKVLVAGKATLYRFVEDNDRIHYFIGKDGNVEELVNHRFLLSGSVQTNRQYIEQLKAAFGDCASIRIGSSLRYDESSLVKIFEQYSACTGSAIATSKKEKTLVKFGIVGSIASDQFGGNPTYPASTGYGAGGFVNFMFPGKLYKWSAYTEVVYRKFGEQTSKSDPQRLDITSIKATVLARNHFNIGKLRSFVNIGISRSGGITDEIQSYNEVVKVNTSFVSGVVGIGAVLKYAGGGPKVIIDARAEYGNGPGVILTITKHVSVGLNVGIQF